MKRILDEFDEGGIGVPIPTEDNTALAQAYPVKTASHPLRLTARELWKQGFKLGLRIGIETMGDASEDLEQITEE